MRTVSLLLLPLQLLWTVVQLLLLPVGVAVVAWWLLPDSWARWVTLAVAGYVLVAWWLLRPVIRGRVRSMTRGTVAVRHTGRGPRGRSPR